MNEKEEMEKQIFIIQMQDRLSSEDYDLLNELNNKLLQNRAEELENERRINCC